MSLSVTVTIECAEGDADELARIFFGGTPDVGPDPWHDEPELVSMSSDAQYILPEDASRARRIPFVACQELNDGSSSVLAYAGGKVASHDSDSEGTPTVRVDEDGDPLKGDLRDARTFRKLEREAHDEMRERAKEGRAAK